MDKEGTEEYASPSEKITIRLPKSFLTILDYLVSVDYFSSRSEAIRIAVRDMVLEKVPEISGRIDKVREVLARAAELEMLQKDMRR